ncbi:hypothetical protein [Aureicoccus marinus]|jgi:dipeptide/tripeptide permease|uniref:Uncharacterized protein n=1 Tax=Aureicoccus marinus TaxID=754435 RepID=A0A2S7T9S3_9FLAO|nr:hypothetical protein [Aureicoccus marinus]PQJ16689.1 hypothetical protein BST99_14035 [Aureicoccus marinus]
MKTYKIKSLVYLSCFVIAAVFYYDYEQNQNSLQIVSENYVEMEAQDLSELQGEEQELLDQNTLD